MNVHRQVGEGVVQLAAHVLGQLDAGHGEGLVRPLGLHLEALGGAELIPQIFLGAGGDGVLILGAGPGAAQTNHAEELLHGLPRALEIAVLAERLHVGGGLAGVDLEGAVFFQPPLGVAHELFLKAPAVEALEDHLAMLEQHDLSHC